MVDTKDDTRIEKAYEKLWNMETENAHSDNPVSGLELFREAIKGLLPTALSEAQKDTTLGASYTELTLDQRIHDLYIDLVDTFKSDKYSDIQKEKRMFYLMNFWMRRNDLAKDIPTEGNAITTPSVDMEYEQGIRSRLKQLQNKKTVDIWEFNEILILEGKIEVLDRLSHTTGGELKPQYNIYF